MANYIVCLVIYGFNIAIIGGLLMLVGTKVVGKRRAVWVAIGGRGRLYGAVLGTVFVTLASSWFTGGGAPDIDLGFYTIQWTDWWLVLLGLSFVAVTLFAPQGLGGLVDKIARKS